MNRTGMAELLEAVRDIEDRVEQINRRDQLESLWVAVEELTRTIDERMTELDR